MRISEMIEILRGFSPDLDVFMTQGDTCEAVRECTLSVIDEDCNILEEDQVPDDDGLYENDFGEQVAGDTVVMVWSV